MAYATLADLQERLVRPLSTTEESACTAMLDDAAALIDAYAIDAPLDVKKIVSCRMVIRAISDSGMDGTPIGATQGSMSGLGYSQSWTIGSGGAAGELYLGKTDKKLLGVGNKIGSHSPVEDKRHAWDHCNTL